MLFCAYYIDLCCANQNAQNNRKLTMHIERVHAREVYYILISLEEVIGYEDRDTYHK